MGCTLHGCQPRHDQMHLLRESLRGRKRGAQIVQILQIRNLRAGFEMKTTKAIAHQRQRNTAQQVDEQRGILRQRRTGCPVERKLRVGAERT